jgi:MFS superfamily sulfate permease-like transporter
VPVVGPLPPGLPSFHLPRVSLAEVQAMLAGGVAIAVISMADTSVLSRTFAGRSGRRIDQDQELLALGSASIGAGLFGGFSVSASASRTPVAVNAGAKTQLASVVGALTIAALLVVAPWLTTNLPESTLAAIVMTASLSLVDIPGTTRLWRLRPTEFVLSVVCLVGVAVAGVVTGIFSAVPCRCCCSSGRGRPHSRSFGRVGSGSHTTSAGTRGASTRRTILFAGMRRSSRTRRVPGP